jgi:hypothetical protein
MTHQMRDSLPSVRVHLPSGYVKIAIEDGLFMVDSPIKDGKSTINHHFQWVNPL